MSVTIVWLDEGVAKIYHFSEDRMEREVLHLEIGSPESDLVLSGHLANSKQILILSPGPVGEDYAKRTQARFPELSRRIVGCETLEKADDVAVADYAIKYFRKPVKQTV